MAPPPAAAQASGLYCGCEISPSCSRNEGRRVCVMDSSGRLGSALVDRLLLRRYTVHAVCLDPARGKIQPFERKYSDNKRLRVFHSDPLDYHSIMDALEGCCGLFYSFEPPSYQPSYNEFTAEIEVRAAHNVLEACAQTDSVEKVVFTSSATAVIWGGRNIESDVDEKNWSSVNFCKKFKLWHGLSKTLSEKTAWALAMDREVNMVSINGGLVMSPDLTVADPYLKGAAEMYEDGVFVTVELRRLVNAHICVFEDIGAYGRYLCFDHVISCNEDALKIARLLLPSSSPQQSSEDMVDGDSRVRPQRISNKKLNKIMVDFNLRRPLVFLAS